MPQILKPATWLIVLFASAGVSHADAQTFTARLSTVPIDVAMQATVTGRGSVTATLSGTRLSINGTFSGLTTPATVARVHRGPKGIRGAALFDVTVDHATSGSIAATVDLDAQQVEDLRQERLYLQLHSEKAPEGNLWGWLLPADTRR